MGALYGDEYRDNEPAQRIDGRVIESEKVVALTFDDGPGQYTDLLLDELGRRGIRATFFLIGENIIERESTVKRMSEEGHLIGNHTFSHIELTKVSAEAADAEVNNTSILIEQITGVSVRFIRPPCGSWNENLLYRFNLIPVLWNVDPMDWNTHNEEEIVQSVMSNVHDGDIILLHDIYRSSVSATFRIIDLLKSQGYRFVTVDEIMID